MKILKYIDVVTNALMKKKCKLACLPLRSSIVIETFNDTVVKFEDQFLKMHLNKPNKTNLDFNSHKPLLHGVLLEEFKILNDF